MMPRIAADPLGSKPSRTLRMVDLVRPHWKALTIALVAVLGETLTAPAAALSALGRDYLQAPAIIFVCLTPR